MAASDDREATLTLPSDREILVVRGFDAKKATVFDAYTKPEHLVHWVCCAELTMTVCEVDLRVGGRWRFVLHDPARGVDHPTSGEYREIAAPERVVFTERYEPVPGSDHVVTLTFEERAGRTVVAQRIVHASKEGRDAHLRAGMEVGLPATFARLEAWLARRGAAALA